jgi:hypothetical protein
MNEELSVNDELYSDIAFQMFSAYMNPNGSMINELMESYSFTNEDDPTFMPGVIFGCMMHMAILLSSIASVTDSSVSDAFSSYAEMYNLEVREQMAKIPGMHQAFAKSVYEKLKQEES